MKSFHNERGFTLLEMLLVLSIVAIVSTVVLQFSIRFSEKRIITQFIQQVQMDIQQLQALSIKEGRALVVDFKLNGYYATYENNKNEILNRTYPKDVSLKYFSTLKRIRITDIGEVQDFGKLIFSTPFGEKQIILNIQKGRMRIVGL